jgi:subtilisin family serine protease
MSEKVYVVTLRRQEDLDKFYTDMSDDGYRLKMKRPISRNTHYWMTDEQAETIRQDSRVLAVELTPEELGIKPIIKSFHNSTEYNIQGDFDKSGTNGGTATNYRQWGHLHSAGTTAQRAKGTWTTGQVNDNNGVNVYNDGRHVDVVICDDFIGRDCEEYYSPTTGITRFVQYEWFNELNTYVTSIDDDGATPLAGQYPYVDNSGNTDYHGTHVAGTVAGQWYGWAREATIYGINAVGIADVGSLLLFDYLRAFHRNKPINAETGKRNPTITNHSWGFGYDLEDFGYDEGTNIPLGDINWIEWNGVTYDANNPGPSGWTWDGIEADFGVRQVAGTIPAHNAALNADIEDAIEDGVVVITAAGNENYYIAEEGDTEWNNRVNIQGISGWIYMNRGGSPSGTRGVINVGSLQPNNNKRSTFTNYGPGVDVFAPGSNIHSSFNNLGTVDSKYTQGSGNYFASISGTSMAAPQVCGLIALAASGKERFTQSDAIAIIDRFGKAGDMTFDVDATGASSFTLDFDAGSNSAYTVNGQDRNTTHSAASNPPIAIIEGDTITLSQPSPNSYSTVNQVIAAPSAATYNVTVTSPNYSSYSLGGTDRLGAVGGDDVTVTINEGDTINFNLSAVDAVHPFYIRDAAGTNNVSSPAATGQGSTGTNTVSWTPTTAGTYSYVCGNHPNMKGTITVLSSGPSYSIEVQDRVLDGSQGNQNNPTINIEYGDALDIELTADFSSHPLYIRDSSNNNVANVDGQGSTNQYQVVGWSRENCPASGTYKYVCDNHPTMSGDIVVHPQGAYYNHPLFLQTVTGPGGTQVSGVTGQGVYSHGQVVWTAPAESAGTYYYQCGVHSAMYGEVIVTATQGVLGIAGNHADASCQKGSPNLEIFATNPRESTGYIAGWYRDVLKGSRRTKSWDQGNRQIFPRSNTYFRP